MNVHCGPMRCQGCGCLVWWGVAIQVLRDPSKSRVRRRGMYDAGSERVHCCVMARAA